MANPHPNTSGLLKGGKPGPHAHTRAWREFCRAITLEDEITMARIRTEMQNGTMNPSLQQTVWHYAFGAPPKKYEVEFGERQRPGLLTRRPIGFDPLDPDNPNHTLISGIYGPDVVIEPLALPAHEEAPGKGKKTIVPKPGVVPPQPELDPQGVKRRVPKRPPEDDGSIPLRVDGV